MAEFVNTDAGNIISRAAKVKGPRHIVLGGKVFVAPEAELRGDRSPDGKPIIALGRYCVVDQAALLDPPERQDRHYPLKLGSYVYVGSHAVVQAATIGSFVVVQKDAKIGRFAVLKDCVVIQAGVSVPPFCVVPPHTLVTSEGMVSLPESAQACIEMFCRKSVAGISWPVPWSNANNVVAL